MLFDGPVEVSQLGTPATPSAGKNKIYPKTDNKWYILNPAGLEVALSVEGHTHTYEPVVSAGTTAQYYRGDKTWQTLNPAAVGLSNVDNTSDATKQAAFQTAFDSRYGQLGGSNTWTGSNLFYRTSAGVAAELRNSTDSPRLLLHQPGTDWLQLAAKSGTGLHIRTGDDSNWEALRAGSIYDTGVRVYSGNNQPNFGNITGSVADGQLPPRIGPKGEGGVYAGDFNNDVNLGSYLKAADAPNNPGASAWGMLFVESPDVNYIIQTFAALYGGSGDEVKFRRHYYVDSGWGAWYRLRESQSEQAALWAPISHTQPFSTITGTIGEAQVLPRHSATGLSNQVSNANSAVYNGVWFYDGTSNGPPTGVDGYILVSNYNDQYLAQTYISVHNDQMWMRRRDAGTWTAWVRIIDKSYGDTLYTIASGTTAQYYRGDKTWQTLDIGAVTGLTTALVSKSDVGHTHSLGSLTGVSLSTPVVGDILRHNGTNWVNAVGTSFFAASSHTHSYEPSYAAGTTSQYYRGDKTWQTLDKTAVGLSNVANLAQVDTTTAQSVGGVKTFTSSPVIPDATTATQAASKGQLDSALSSLPTMGQEMAAIEKTSNFTTTNTTPWATAGASKITGLTVTVTGTGRPVDVEFYTSNMYHSIASFASPVYTGTYLIVNSATNNANSVTATTVTFGTAAGPHTYMKKRLVLTNGVSYQFEVGVFSTTGGTTTVFGSSSSPMLLAVTQR